MTGRRALLALALVLARPAAAAEPVDVEASIVRIVNHSQRGDWYAPWDAFSTQESSGTGFVVPDGSVPELRIDELERALREAFPAYMVPSRFGILESLPRNVSGKLDRKALPVLPAPEAGERRGLDLVEHGEEAYGSGEGAILVALADGPAPAGRPASVPSTDPHVALIDPAGEPAGA